MGVFSEDVLDFFSPSNAAANFFILAGLLYAIGFCFYRLGTEGPAAAREEDGPGPNALATGGVYLLKPATFPLFLGSSVYTFEGIGLVLPLLSTTSPSLRPYYKDVMSSTVYGLLVVYICIGSVGYVAFGDEVSPAITSSLPQRDVFTIAVELGFCLALLFTYPIMLFPVIGIVESKLLGPSSSNAEETTSVKPGGETREMMWKSNAVRTGIVVFTALASIGLEGSLDNLVALVGALCSLPLSFIYPSLFHSEIIGTHRKRNNWIAGLGVVMMIGSTFFAIVTWQNSDSDTCKKEHY